MGDVAQPEWDGPPPNKRFELKRSRVFERKQHLDLLKVVGKKIFANDGLMMIYHGRK